MKKLIYFSTFTFIGLIFNACLSDDDLPKQVNETEVITDVVLDFKSADGQDTSYVYVDRKYRAKDYEDPIIRLDKNKTYDVAIHFYDRSNPDAIDDITEEVIEEKDDHFVEYEFYNTTIDLNRIDEAETTDDNGIPIGLFTSWKTEDASEGSVRIHLVHQPEEKIVDDPQGTHTGGETDAEVDFDLIVE